MYTLKLQDKSMQRLLAIVIACMVDHISSGCFRECGRKLIGVNKCFNG